MGAMVNDDVLELLAKHYTPGEFLDALDEYIEMDIEIVLTWLLDSGILCMDEVEDFCERCKVE